MKKILLYLLLVPLFGQVTLTEEELLNIANNIKELQYSDSIKTVQLGICEDLVKAMEEQAIVDSLLLVKKDEQIKLLEERNIATEEMVNLVKPKWYEHRYLWYVYGIVSVVIPVWILGQLN